MPMPDSRRGPADGPGVSLIPEENLKVLTAADRDAAIVIGDHAKHLLAIEP